jgi:hypothetical protein
MSPKTETNTTSLAVIGVDIGKEVFHLVGLRMAVGGATPFALDPDPPPLLIRRDPCGGLIKLIGLRVDPNCRITPLLNG